MGRRIVAWIVLTCCGVTASAPALTADDYVVAGRAALFERTRAGLVQACDIFTAGIEDVDCPDCDGDRELIFLHAIARTGRLFVEGRDILRAEDFLALAETLGVPLQAVTFWYGEAVDGAPDHVWELDLIVSELEAIVADLEAITDEPDPFVVYLVPEETGLTADLEIDFGDVLIFKGLLLAYKGLLEMQMVPETAERVGRGDAWHRDLVETLSVLAGADGGMDWVAQARDDWMNALAYQIAATEYIMQEDCPAGSDPQEDEFVYVDGDAQPSLDAYRQLLAVLRNSLGARETRAVAAGTVRTYELYDADSMRAGDLTLAFDLSHTGGRSGRLVLTDGTVFDVDWFGPLDEGQIGVSLFAQQDDREGWLEVALDKDLSLIHAATLELWGTQSATTVTLTGRIAPEGAASATSDEMGRCNPWTAVPPFDSAGGSWIQVARVLTPISSLWLALGHVDAASGEMLHVDQ